jgi:hypothetical protein
MEKRFKIIEEGRLSKSEMQEVLGGYLYCKPEYVVKECNINGTTVQYAICGGTYQSCTKTGGLQSCIKETGYTGKPGPGGDVVPYGPGSVDVGTTAITDGPNGNIYLGGTN